MLDAVGLGVGNEMNEIVDPADTPRAQLLERARLYVLVDAGDPLPRWRRRIEMLVHAGVDILQLRDKRLDDRSLLERARTLREMTRGTQTAFIMNDRPDLAVLAEADGVHVGQDELRPLDVRTIVGPKRLVGLSTHSMDQVRQAIADGVDYIGVGPTFPSTTKEFHQFPGLALLRQVFAGEHVVGLPAFAIGGIQLTNLSEVLRTGCRRIVVSGAVREVENLDTVVRQFREQLDAAHVDQRFPADVSVGDACGSVKP